jgi:polyphenol oxidase
MQLHSKGFHRLDCFGPGIVAAFSERRFDEHSRDEFLRELNLDPSRFRKAKQVHGDVILDVRSDAWFPFETEADGLVTAETGTVIGIKTADCIPAFFWDPVRKVAAVTHAGWKGVKLEILPKTVRFMAEHHGSRPADVRVAFGPAIGECCYEVGPEFKEYFPDFFKPKPGGKGHVNLISVARRQLEQAGIPSIAISDAGICTSCSSDTFYSARKGAKTERILSIISFC